jgi:UDP-N-acetylglucosamine transferase subunit ALG13
VIFLTIGSHEPFDRLVQAVDQWAATARNADVFGQITDNGIYKPQHFQTTAYLDAATYKAVIAKCELIIAHAGMGSIITAMECGKPIVVMPRRGHLQETRNDHQFASAKKFTAKPGIYVAEDEHCLAATIDTARAGHANAEVSTARPFAQPELIRFLTGVFGGK